MKKLVAVYGSLRKGLHNHRPYLGEATFLGTFNTEPEFSLYSLGSYPGLKQNGNTSIVMEVYEVTEPEAKSIDYLEGYSENSRNTFYDKIKINTPYGEASTYIFVPDVSGKDFVESGDWYDFKTNRDSSLVDRYSSVHNN